ENMGDIRRTGRCKHPTPHSHNPRPYERIYYDTYYVSSITRAEDMGFSVDCCRIMSFIQFVLLEITMKQDQKIFDALREDLVELTALHALSGAEQPVIARLRDLFSPLVDSLSVDHMGNLTATREGPQGSPHIVVSAHADEIGAMVASIEPEGFLRLFPLGGVQPRLL